MATFPEPPPRAELQALGPILKTLSKGTLVARVYFRGGPHPTTWNRFRWFGPAGARFDHHTLPRRVQKRGITYLASNGVTCLAEVFQDTRVIDRSRHNPWLVTFEMDRGVKLLDLTGNWPTRAGASMAINSGSHAKARVWSRAIYAAYPEVEGLYYCSAMHGNEPAVALYERAEDAFPKSPTFHRALVDPGLLTPLANAALDLNYGLV
jgi:hypothetical protein